MATTDVSFTYDLFKIYKSFEWTNNLSLTKKIWIFFSFIIDAYHTILTKKDILKQLYLKWIIHIYQPLHSGRIWHKVNF